jgi:hypothetical protein
MNSEHKRSHDRLRHPFLVKFRIYKNSSGQEGVRWDVVTIRNISPGGISFNYTQRFPLGTVLELDMGLSSLAGTIHCLGTVCRVDELPPKRPDIKTIPVYGIAVKFSDLPDNKREIIERLILEFEVPGQDGSNV